ncbi:MAG: hypothetical protein ABI563_07040 [Specibacter sp.]
MQPPGVTIGTDTPPCGCGGPHVSAITPGAENQTLGCTTCGHVQGLVNVAQAAGGFVYAVGHLRARFPNLGAEKEYAQQTDSDPDALIRTQEMKTTLLDETNRHLARQMQWIFTGPASEVCTVVTRESADLVNLVEALSDDDQTVHALIGHVAVYVEPSASVQPNLPAVWVDQLFSFTVEEFVRSLPDPDRESKVEDAEAWIRTSRQLFSWLTQRSGNRGLSDQHRAMNYLALRYPPIYHLAFNQQHEGKALIGVEAHLTPNGGRREVAVRFIFRHAQTHVTERYDCQVDTHDLFPFLTRSLMLSYD